MDFDIENCIIFECLTGSHLYGTNTPESDIDRRGICLPPIESMLELDYSFEQKDKWGGEDRVIYSLKKFFSLATNCNPNIIELFFAPEKIWIKSSNIWQEIVGHRYLFLSTLAKGSFLGYANAQLARIKRHRSWLLDPPKKIPMREEYGLENESKFTPEQLTAITILPEHIIEQKFRQEVVSEKAYKQAMIYWKAYVNWKESRNPVRAETEKKFGYDTKHASHLVRLIYEGKELLETGKISFPLPFYEEVLEIKNGKYSYEELIKLVGEFDNRLRKASERSVLSRSPDKEGIKDLYKKIICERF